MSKSKEELGTVHGVVEYETVECTSCGEKVVEEDALTIFVGEYHGKSSRSYESYDRIKLANYKKGYLCPYCTDDPAKYPQRKWYDPIPFIWESMSDLDGEQWFVAMIFVFLAVIGLLLILA